MATKKGRLSANDFRELINKAAGEKVAYNLNDENPTLVPFYISTGSTILDRIICMGKIGGIPANKVIEIAGEEGVGKSYLCATTAYHAQVDHDMDVILFDSENAIDPDFLRNQGINLDKLVYVQAKTVEFVLETIDQILPHLDHPTLFIWDSLAMTPTAKIAEGGMDVSKDVATKARVLAHGISKLQIPLANAGATLIVTNQLKKPIGGGNIAMYKLAKGIIDLDTRNAPGGKTLPHSYSLRIWLTKDQTAKDKIVDDNGIQVGANVKAKLVKSRFGTENRTCKFGLSWGGGKARIIEEDAWLEICKQNGLVKGGAWHKLYLNPDDPLNFRMNEWNDLLQEPEIKAKVMEALDQELVFKFAECPTDMDPEEAGAMNEIQEIVSKKINE